MLKRPILKITSLIVAGRTHGPITCQVPACLFFRKEFSSSSKHNTFHGGGSKESQSKSVYLTRVLIGSLALGVAGTTYWAGYFDKFLTKDQPDSAIINVDSNVAKKIQYLGDNMPVLNQKAGQDKNLETDAKSLQPEQSSLKRAEGQSDNSSDLTDKKDTVLANQEEVFPNDSQTTMSSDNQNASSIILSERSQDMKSKDGPTDRKPKEVPVASFSSEVHTIPKQKEMNLTPPESFMTNNIKDKVGKSLEVGVSLLDEYHLLDNVATTKADDDQEKSSIDREDAVVLIADINESCISKDGKLVLDFIEAIHAAEKRQSDLDAHNFSKEITILKANFEKDLKDARARELMYAEEAAILDKELNKEKLKAASAIKSLHEKAEDKLKMELKKKESETELKLKELRELGKAELAAAIATEKASQIEKMAEADLHINALCLAFYAQSKEAHQRHSLHKLALGALAMEDALSKGLPVQAEIKALQSCIDGIDKESLLELVLSSLPEETRTYGTDTLSQLHHKLDCLKGTVRHLSLIPSGGGGILTHSLARVLSWLKVKDVWESGDGIEGVMKKVERCVAEGKLAEAACALEDGVRGSKAAEIEIVGEWVRQARNRAITDQALTLLHAFLTSITLA